MVSGMKPQQAESKMVNTIVFYQVSNELARVVSELESWENDHGDDLSSDIEQVREMINHISGLTDRYKALHPNIIDPAVIAGVYQDIEAMYAEIRAEILSSIQDERDSDQIGAAIARLFKIANWHESDGDPRSLRLDAMFAPLFHEDPTECIELCKAQDTFCAYLENMMLELNEKLPSPAHA